MREQAIWPHQMIVKIENGMVSQIQTKGTTLLREKVALCYCRNGESSIIEIIETIAQTIWFDNQNHSIIYQTFWVATLTNRVRYFYYNNI